jgi:hypothetical protein
MQLFRFSLGFRHLLPQPAGSILQRSHLRIHGVQLGLGPAQAKIVLEVGVGNHKAPLAIKFLKAVHVSTPPNIDQSMKAARRQPPPWHASHQSAPQDHRVEPANLGVMLPLLVLGRLCPALLQLRRDLFAQDLVDLVKLRLLLAQHYWATLKSAGGRNADDIDFSPSRSLL